VCSTVPAAKLAAARDAALIIAYSARPACCTHHLPEPGIGCHDLCPALSPVQPCITIVMACSLPRCASFQLRSFVAGVLVLVLPAPLPLAFLGLCVVVGLLLPQRYGQGYECEGTAPKDDVASQGDEGVLLGPQTKQTWGKGMAAGALLSAGDTCRAGHCLQNPSEITYST